MNAVTTFLLLLPIAYCYRGDSVPLPLRSSHLTSHSPDRETTTGKPNGETRDQTKPIMSKMLVESHSANMKFIEKLTMYVTNQTDCKAQVEAKCCSKMTKELKSTDTELQQNIYNLQQNCSNATTKIEVEIKEIQVNFSDKVEDVTERLQNHLAKAIKSETDTKTEINEIQTNLSNVTNRLRSTENRLVNTEEKLKQTVEKLNQKIDRLTNNLGQQQIFSQVLVNRISQAKTEAAVDNISLKQNLTRFVNSISATTKAAKSQRELIKQAISNYRKCNTMQTLINLEIIPVRHLPYTCNFDTDMCGITQSTGDHFDWTRRTGPTPDRNNYGVGPSCDHTGSGYYVYVEGDGHNPNQKAKIQTPVMSEPGVKCLQFFYHMYAISTYAHHIGSLNVYTTSTGPSNPIWTKSGCQKDRWNRATITLPSGIYAVGFQAITKTHWASDIAIDDITIRKGCC